MLCECHAHAALSGHYWKAALARHEKSVDCQAVRDELERYRQAGVEYVRDGGDKFGACAYAASVAGEYGIEYVHPAFPIHQKGLYGSFIGAGFDTKEECFALIDEAIRQGADFIKLMLSGIVSFTEYGVISCPPLDFDLAKHAIDYAHEKGFPVMVHVNGARAVEAAAKAGVDSVEHGYFLDEEALRALAQNNTVWVPTLSPMANILGSGRGDDETLEKVLANQAHSLRRGAELGVAIACGSDAGAGLVFHGQGALDEMSHLHKALGAQANEVIECGNTLLRERFARCAK